jgi:hypothetical protein
LPYIYNTRTRVVHHPKTYCAHCARMRKWNLVVVATPPLGARTCLLCLTERPPV